MSITSVNFGSSLLGLSVQNINKELAELSTELSTGKKSTDYAGMGVGEGFAVAARAQLSDISAFSTTISNVTTIIGTGNTALQGVNDAAVELHKNALTSSQDLTAAGQTVGQVNARAELTSIVGMLNTQAGDRYLFSGSAIDKPAVITADDMLNGTATQAGLTQVIDERRQADLGTTGLGRLVITAPTATSVQVAEDVAGSPFGLKLNGVSSSLTGAVVTGPAGSPPAASINLTANPNSGDQVKFTFNLPDGTTETIQLTASSATPLPAGSFAIGATPTATAANLNAALNTAISALANTSLVAASAITAGNEFFDPAGLAVGAVANSKAAAPITGATTLSGAAASNSLSTDFAPGDPITVNGTTITFVAAGATGNQLNVTDSVQTLLSKIDSITGTSTPSTVSGGVITLRTDNAATLNITSSNAPALASLGFVGPVTAIQPPLRVSGAPFATATSLVNGSANTIAWYTGNSGPGSPRASSTVRIDQAETLQFGVQANEEGIRSIVKLMAVYGAVTMSTTSPNSAGEVTALSQRIAANLTVSPGHQSINDIQTDLANAQLHIKNVQSRQSQSKTILQNLVDQTETVSTPEIASKILALQTSLQASYQTTSMLSQLSLVKFLPAG